MHEEGKEVSERVGGSGSLGFESRISNHCRVRLPLPCVYIIHQLSGGSDGLERQRWLPGSGEACVTSIWDAHLNPRPEKGRSYSGWRCGNGHGCRLRYQDREETRQEEMTCPGFQGKSECENFREHRNDSRRVRSSLSGPGLFHLTECSLGFIPIPAH